MPYTRPSPAGSVPYSQLRSPAFGVPALAADHEWQLFDRVPQAVTVTDADGTVVYWNAAATALYGWSEVEALGRNVVALTPAESATAAAAEVVARLQAGQPFTGEFELRRKSGETFVGMVTGTPILDEAGHVIGILGMSTDLTEQRARERALAQERDLAVRTDRQKTEFLAMVSHELRTPLSAILGYDELLASGVGGQLSEQHRVYVERIRASSYHLRELINQILGLSRVMAGKEEVRVETVSLAHFARETAALMEPEAAAKGLELRVCTDAGEHVTIETDSGKLRQVLLNLLANAVKFTPGGHVTLVTRHQGGATVFEVRDTGIGFEPGSAELLFEPFYRATTAHAMTGSGLGLAIVERLVRLLGGVVETESEPGSGSVFRVRIPSVLASPDQH